MFSKNRKLDLETGEFGERKFGFESAPFGAD